MGRPKDATNINQYGWSMSDVSVCKFMKRLGLTADNLHLRC